jgi:hypothetical protein
MSSLCIQKRRSKLYSDRWIRLWFCKLRKPLHLFTRGFCRSEQLFGTIPFKGSQTNQICPVHCACHLDCRALPLQKSPHASGLLASDKKCTEQARSAGLESRGVQGETSRNAFSPQTPGHAPFRDMAGENILWTIQAHIQGFFRSNADRTMPPSGPGRIVRFSPAETSSASILAV